MQREDTLLTFLCSRDIYSPREHCKCTVTHTQNILRLSADDESLHQKEAMSRNESPILHSAYSSPVWDLLNRWQHTQMHWVQVTVSPWVGITQVINDIRAICLTHMRVFHVYACARECLCVCVCLRMCVRACVRACVPACVHVCLS